MRLELTRVGLLAELANHYTTMERKFVTLLWLRNVWLNVNYTVKQKTRFGFAKLSDRVQLTLYVHCN